MMKKQIFFLSFVFLLLVKDLSLGQVLRRIRDPGEIEHISQAHILTLGQYLQQHPDKNIPLVIGATGFIGSHIIDYLLSQRKEVLGITRSRDLDRIKNIAPNLENQRLFTVKIEDYLEDLRSLEEIVRQSPVIYLVYGPRETKIKTDEEMMDYFYNYGLVAGTVAKLADKHHKKIVYVSTTFFYHNLLDKTKPVNEKTPLPLPQKVKDLIQQTSAAFYVYISQLVRGGARESPRDFLKTYLNNPLFIQRLQEVQALLPVGAIYTIAKLIGERLVGREMRESQTAILRVANVYGPRNEGDVVSRMIENLMRGEDLDVSNDFRNFVYVEDLAKAIVQAGDRDLEEIEHYIIASDKGSTTMRKLAEEIRDIFFALFPEFRGLPIKIVERDVGNRVITIPSFDITKAKEELGFRPRPLPQGLRKTLEWFRNRRAG